MVIGAEGLRLRSGRQAWHRFRSDFGPAEEELRNKVAGRPTAETPFRRLAFYVWTELIYALRRATPGLRGPAIYLYPKAPNVHYVIWPICHLLGLRRTDDPREAALAVLFDDRDFEDGADLDAAAAELERSAGVSGVPVLNVGCTDISKHTVGRVFEEVFGYPMSVDPVSHQGAAVEKSDANARHDGRIVQCPLPAAAPDRAYQVLVDSRRDDGLVEHLRVPVVGNSIPLVYVKHVAIGERFADRLARPARVHDVREYLSSDEVERIVTVCRRLGVDFGECDVMRDNRTRRLYVVDVGKTPYGPPKWMPFLERFRAAVRLARSFSAEFLASPRR